MLRVSGATSLGSNLESSIGVPVRIDAPPDQIAADEILARFDVAVQLCAADDVRPEEGGRGDLLLDDLHGFLVFLFGLEVPELVVLDGSHVQQVGFLSWQRGVPERPWWRRPGLPSTWSWRPHSHSSRG